MAFAATFRGVRAALPATAQAPAPAIPGPWSPLRSLAGLIVDSRRRRALREIRRHQAFGPLISIRHIGLTRDELLPF